VVDRGAVRASDLSVLTGAGPDAAVGRGAVRLGPWLASPEGLEGAAAVLTSALRAHHDEHPLVEGVEVADARATLAAAGAAFADPGLADRVLTHLAEAGRIVRSGSTVRLPDHHPTTAGRSDADRLVAAVAGAEPSPPTVKELRAAGFGIELIRAVCADSRLVRISPDVVVTPGFLARAEEVVRSLARPPGVTVSSFRGALGTSRKYALPILEYFDANGLTRRQGDLRVVRS
jgi:selenocysteine-specific elongation factor